MYEIVSDINTRQELIDERIISLEDRMSILCEQLESMPDALYKVILQSTLITHPPILLDNSATGNNPNHNAGSQNTQSNANPSEQSTHKHTHLHPNDAASLANRTSWSASNINATQSNPTGRHLLSPMVLRTSSFDA